MLKIKLSKLGSPHKPFYRIVVAEARSKRNGKTVDSLGFYEPKTRPATLKIDKKKLDGWLSKGAKPTRTLTKLLK